MVGIVVIAAFYGDNLSRSWPDVAGSTVLSVVALRMVRVRTIAVSAAPAAVMWVMWVCVVSEQGLAGTQLLAEARFGVLVASVSAAVVGTLLLVHAETGNDNR